MASIGDIPEIPEIPTAGFLLMREPDDPAMTREYAVGNWYCDEDGQVFREASPYIKDSGDWPYCHIDDVELFTPAIFMPTAVAQAAGLLGHGDVVVDPKLRQLYYVDGRNSSVGIGRDRAAVIAASIWSDPRFCALTWESRHLYLMALTCLDSNPDGTHAWEPRRLADSSGNGTIELVNRCFRELVDHNIFVADDEPLTISPGTPIVIRALGDQGSEVDGE